MGVPGTMGGNANQKSIRALWAGTGLDAAFFDGAGDWLMVTNHNGARHSLRRRVPPNFCVPLAELLAL